MEKSKIRALVSSSIFSLALSSQEKFKLSTNVTYKGDDKTSSHPAGHTTIRYFTLLTLTINRNE